MSDLAQSFVLYLESTWRTENLINQPTQLSFTRQVNRHTIGFKMSALIELVYSYKAEWYQDDNATSRRLGKILTKLKYYKKTAREDGKAVKLWFPPSK